MDKDLYSIAFGGRRFLWQVSLGNSDAYAIEFTPYLLRTEHEIDKFREFLKILYDLGIKSRITPLYSVEIAADIDKLRFRIVASKGLISAIEKALLDTFDVCSLNIVNFESVSRAVSGRKLPTKTLRFELKQPFAFPITTYKKFVTVDVLSGFFSVIDTLGKGEHVDMALVLRPFPKVWLDYGLTVQKQLRHGEGIMDFLEFLYSGGPVARVLVKLIGLVKKPADKAFTRVPDKYTARMIAQINRKLEDPIGFTFTGYINLQTIDKDSLLELKKRVATAFSRFENPPFNSLVFKDAEFNDFLKRSHPPANLSILNSEEVASLWHFPVGIQVRNVSGKFIKAPVGFATVTKQVRPGEANKFYRHRLSEDATNKYLGYIKLGSNFYPFNLADIDVTNSLLIGQTQNAYFRRVLSHLLDFFIDKYYPLFVVDNLRHSIIEEILKSKNVVTRSVSLDNEQAFNRSIFDYLPVWLKERTVFSLKVPSSMAVSVLRDVFGKIAKRLSGYLDVDMSVPMILASSQFEHNRVFWEMTNKVTPIKRYALLDEGTMGAVKDSQSDVKDFIPNFNAYFVSRVTSPFIANAVSELDDSIDSVDILHGGKQVLHVRPQVNGVVYPFFSVWLPND